MSSSLNYCNVILIFYFILHRLTNHVYIICYYGILLKKIKTYPFATPTNAGLTIRSCSLYPIFDTTTTVPGSFPSTSC